MTGWRLRIWTPLTLALSSAASMALEIVAGRALAPYVGMSLYSWTAIIAVVLGGLSLGHWLGGALSDRTRRPALWVAGALLAACAATLLSLPALRAAAPALGRLDPISGVGLLAGAGFLLPSLLVGVLSPLLTRMALDGAAPERRGRVLGRMFALGAAGAILGTLAAGMLMISWIGVGGSVALIAAVYAALAAPFLPGRAGLAAGALGALAASGAGRLDAFASPCLEESAYYCIRVDDLPGSRPARVMALDHLAHSINDRDDPEFLHAPYVRALDEIVRRRFPGPALEAFFVGGGAYTLPRAWASAYPKARLVVAEIDPAVTRAAQAHLWFAPDSRIEIRHRDARRALADLPPDRRFDVIFGDAFHDVAIPQHLTTDEFHARIARRLRPGGIYAINVVEALREPPFLLSLVRTLRQRFAHVDLWLDAADLQRTEKRVTWLVVASQDPAPEPRVLTASRAPGGEWVRVEGERMLRALPRARTVLLSDDFSPVDRLMRHILFDPALAE